MAVPLPYAEAPKMGQMQGMIPYGYNPMTGWKQTVDQIGAHRQVGREYAYKVHYRGDPTDKDEWLTTQEMLDATPYGVWVPYLDRHRLKRTLLKKQE